MHALQLRKEDSSSFSAQDRMTLRRVHACWSCCSRRVIQVSATMQVQVLSFGVNACLYAANGGQLMAPQWCRPQDCPWYGPTSPLAAEARACGADPVQGQRLLWRSGQVHFFRLLRSSRGTQTLQSILQGRLKDIQPQRGRGEGPPLLKEAIYIR